MMIAVTAGPITRFTAMKSFSLSSQKDRFQPSFVEKYSQNDGSPEAAVSRKNQKPMPKRTALVQVHSNSRRKLFPRSMRGASRRSRPFGMGSLTVGSLV